MQKHTVEQSILNLYIEAATLHNVPLKTVQLYISFFLSLILSGLIFLSVILNQRIIFNSDEIIKKSQHGADSGAHR